MIFEPLTDEQIESQKKRLIPGMADFEILDAKEKTSKSGNPMIEVILRVWDSEGTQGQLKDFLPSNVQWKIKSILQAINKGDLYQTGNVTSLDLVMGCGKCMLGMEKSRDPQFPDQIRVKEYLSLETTNNDSDDIQF